MMSLQNLAKKSIASQDKFELWQLLELVARLQPTRILEIGVHRGGMVQTFREAFPQAFVVGVDKDFSPLEFTDFHALAGDSNQPSMREAVLDAFKGNQVDFVFIDGDHHYDATMKDFELYGPLVRPGGLIAFHDIMRDPERVPHHEGVEARRVFDELKQKHASLEIWNGTAGDNAPGIGVLFV